MNQNPQTIIGRIKQIRELDHRSEKDCASALGIPIEQYRQMENGNATLTLPDLELLAFFFKVPVTELLEEQKLDEFGVPVIENQLQNQYRKLRHKLLSVTLLDALDAQNLTLEDLHQQTQIQVDALQSYLDGLKAIPLEHLQSLSESLSISDQIFGNQTTDNLPIPDEPINPVDWELEYPQAVIEESDLDESVDPDQHN